MIETMAGWLAGPGRPCEPRSRCKSGPTDHSYILRTQNILFCKKENDIHGVEYPKHQQHQVSPCHAEGFTIFCLGFFNPLLQHRRNQVSYPLPHAEVWCGRSFTFGTQKTEMSIIPLQLKSSITNIHFLN